MTNQTTSAEEIYAALEIIYRGTGIIRDAHGANIFKNQHWPPGGGAGCMVPDQKVLEPVQIYEALLGLQDRVQNIVKEYAAFYGPF